MKLLSISRASLFKISSLRQWSQRFTCQTFLSLTILPGALTQSLCQGRNLESRLSETINSNASSSLITSGSKSDHLSDSTYFQLYDRETIPWVLIIPRLQRKHYLSQCTRRYCPGHCTRQCRCELALSIQRDSIPRGSFPYIILPGQLIHFPLYLLNQD